MEINAEKTKVVQFRPRSTTQTNVTFKIGQKIIDIATLYKYLGLVIDEFLNYETTAKLLLIQRHVHLVPLVLNLKVLEVFLTKCFTKLYDSVVWPKKAMVQSYGLKLFSCINAVQNRACRFFLGVGKYTPTNGVNRDMGWKPPALRQWICVLRKKNSRFEYMDDNRINKKKVYDWMCCRSCKSWKFRINKQSELYNIEEDRDKVVSLLEFKMFEKHKTEWRVQINSKTGTRPNQSNKLCTYELFKHEYKTEAYLTNTIPRGHRTALAKFRFGVVPLRLETDRYERIPVEQRLCFICDNVVEDELHVLINCPLYHDLRVDLYS